MNPIDWFLTALSWVDTLPRWQRPIFNGAVLVLAWFIARGGFVVFPLLLVYAAITSGMGLAAKWALLIPAAVIAGGLGGGVYGLLLPVRKMGAAGIWLTWVLSVGTYLLPLSALIGWIDPSRQLPLTAAVTWWIMVIVSLICGSVAMWIFGDEDDPHSTDNRAPSAKGLFAEAVAAELSLLRTEAARDPGARADLPLVENDTPSKAVVMHWWRVVGRLGRYGDTTMDLPLRWALAKAEAKLRRAQAQWPKPSAS